MAPAPMPGKHSGVAREPVPCREGRTDECHTHCGRAAVPGRPPASGLLLLGRNCGESWRDGLGELGSIPRALPAPQPERCRASSPTSCAAAPLQGGAHSCWVRAAFPAGSGRTTAPTSQSYTAPRALGHHTVPEAGVSPLPEAGRNCHLEELIPGFISPSCSGTSGDGPEAVSQGERAFSSGLWAAAGRRGLVVTPVSSQSPPYSSGSYDSIKTEVSGCPEDLTVGRAPTADEDDDDHDDHEDNDKINDSEGMDPERLKAFNVRRAAQGGRAHLPLVSVFPLSVFSFADVCAPFCGREPGPDGSHL